jgi:TFIIE alpha subunit
MKRLFVKALKNKFNMAKEDAIELAKTVEGIFNGEKEIEDMTIDKYARSLFYELQRERLLKLRRDEYKEEGKYIRKYYWSFNNDTIKEVACEKYKEEKYQIYQKIPENAWVTRTYCN